LDNRYLSVVIGGFWFSRDYNNGLSFCFTPNVLIRLSHSYSCASSIIPWSAVFGFCIGMPESMFAHHPQPAVTRHTYLTPVATVPLTNSLQLTQLQTTHNS